MSDPFGTAAADDWSEAFGVGAARSEEPGGDPTDPAATAGADAVTGAFDFEPDSVSSDDDYDFTGDGVVDRHDVHEAISGFHDFHVDEAEEAHHEPVDHHVDGHHADGHVDDLALPHHQHDPHDGGGLLGF